MTNTGSTGSEADVVGGCRNTDNWNTQSCWDGCTRICDSRRKPNSNN